MKRNMVNKIFNTDCLPFMREQMPDDSVDLIITDPPFNIGKKYASNFKDNKKNGEYLKWCKEWLTECVRVLKPHGSLYLFNYPENNALLLPFLNEKMLFKRWMTWHYPTNTGMSPTSFTRSQHSILFYTKSADATWNKEDIAEPYRNPTDKRIKERMRNGSNGKTPYDVFQFNIVKNVSKEKTEHICQLPTELLKIFVKASSNPGDLVFDPFMGSGTSAVAAKQLGRKYLGCELSSRYCEIIEDRLAPIQFGEELQKISSKNIMSFLL